MGILQSCLLSMAGSIAVSVSTAALRRTGYFGLISYTFLLAHAVSTDLVLSKVNMAHTLGRFKGLMEVSTGCNPTELLSCEKAQVMYRASMALFIVCLGLASFSSLFSRYAIRGLWVIKAGFTTVLLACLLLWAPNGAFIHWAGAARLLSLPWLLMQGLVVLDAGYAAHEALNAKADRVEAVGGTAAAAVWRSIYLGTCMLLLGGAVATLAQLQGPAAACGGGLGSAMVALTLVWGVLATVASMLNSVGAGLLPPSVAFAYSALLCWHYLPLDGHGDTCAQTELHASSTSSKALMALVFLTVARCSLRQGGLLSLLGLTDTNTSALEQTHQNGITSGSSIGAPAAAYGSTASIGLVAVTADVTVEEVAFVEDAAMCALVAVAGLAVAMFATGWSKPDGTPQEGLGGVAFWTVLLGQVGTAVMHGCALWNAYTEEADGIYATF
eukprot:TRINITY_DN1778_c0_g1_i4.p1 TRINITY_DN1778_c0_g1~~TRINITY_DN1778_c0_g1_i4.p1  ORF type:complete len:442 (-),score=69.02 TRINITY_DN1778_c0_g1_i4:635-1960(-)